MKLSSLRELLMECTFRNKALRHVKAQYTSASTSFLQSKMANVSWVNLSTDYLLLCHFQELLNSYIAPSLLCEYVSVTVLSRKNLPSQLQGGQLADSHPAVSILRLCLNFWAKAKYFQSSPRQWLSTVRVEAPGNFCSEIYLPHHLCSRTPLWVGEVFVINVW